jgi:hypothetical protein
MNTYERIAQLIYESLSVNERTGQARTDRLIRAGRERSGINPQLKRAERMGVDLKTASPTKIGKASGDSTVQGIIRGTGSPRTPKKQRLTSTPKK